tara:strand:+ start:1738 stop:3948 length:2211 start_codon:yes stop_codon:yes gene_type:complete
MFYSTNGKLESSNNSKLIEGFSKKTSCGFKSKDDIPYNIDIGAENITNWEFLHAYSIKKVKLEYTSKDYLRIEFRKKILDGKLKEPVIRRFEINSNIPTIDVFTIAVGGGAGGGEMKHTSKRQGKGGGGGGVVFGYLSFANNKSYVILPGSGGLFNNEGENTEIYDPSASSSSDNMPPVVYAGGGGKSDGLDKGGTCFVVSNLRNNFSDNVSLISNNTQQGQSFTTQTRKFNGKDDNQSLNCENFGQVYLNDFNGVLCQFDGKKYSGGGESGITNSMLRSRGNYCWEDDDCNNKITKNVGRGGSGKGCSDISGINKGVDGAVVLYIDFDYILLTNQSIKKEKKDGLNVPEKWKTWIPNEMINRYFIKNNYFQDVKERSQQVINGKNTILLSDIKEKGFPNKIKTLDLTDVNVGKDFDGKPKTSQNVIPGWEVEGNKVYIHSDNQQTETGDMLPFSTKGNYFIGLKREDNSTPPSIKTFSEGFKKGWPYSLIISCRKDPKCSKADNILKLELFFQGTTKRKTFNFTIPDDDSWIVKPFYFESESEKIDIKLSNVSNYDDTLYCENYSQIYIDNIEILKEKIINPSKVKSIDCKGTWSKCDENCIKKWKMERPAEGPNGKCSNVENQVEICKPGEGNCPLDKDCEGNWGICDQDCLQKWRLKNNGQATGKGKCGFVDGMQRKCYSGGLCGKFKSSSNDEKVCQECQSIDFFVVLIIIGLIIGFLISFALFKDKIITSD